MKNWWEYVGVFWCVYLNTSHSPKSGKKRRSLCATSKMFLYVRKLGTREEASASGKNTSLGWKLVPSFSSLFSAFHPFLLPRYSSRLFGFQFPVSGFHATSLIHTSKYARMHPPQCSYFLLFLFCTVQQCAGVFRGRKTKRIIPGKWKGELLRLMEKTEGRERASSSRVLKSAGIIALL